MKQLAIALIGLPISLLVLLYLGFCAVMSHLTGESSRRYQLSPLPKPRPTP
jgi:hypothetical protein